jgi:hypothetical protein
MIAISFSLSPCGRGCRVRGSSPNAPLIRPTATFSRKGRRNITFATVFVTLIMNSFLVPANATAGFNSDARGTTTASFLTLGVGARAEAMGEAFTAVADDATSLYWNPAGMARVDGGSAAFMHAPYLASTYYDYGAYAQRWGHHSFGLGVQYFSAGSINQTDPNDVALGSFSPYDLAATFGYAYRLDEAGDAFGVSTKFVQSKILNTASTLSFDAGFQSRPYWERLRLAIAASNLGGKMKFEQESEALPTIVRLGSAFAISPRWSASMDIIAPKNNAGYLALGTEYRWPFSDGLTLAGRCGYNSRTTGDISGVTGFSTGFGLGWRAFSFDYALVPYGGLGLTQRISLSLRFGAAVNERSAALTRHPSTFEDAVEDLP